MNLFDFLMKVNPSVKSLNIQEIRKEEDKVIGWHATIVTLTDEAFAGGTHTDKETAIRIAVAECFERSIFLNLSAKSSDENDLSLMLKEHPSSSGFACGFDKETTKFRSICEGIERWAWSQWIDEGYALPRISGNEHLSPLASHLKDKFSKATFFSKHIHYMNRKFRFVVFLGEYSNGIFAGSRVSTEEDLEIWEHPIVEAYRNLVSFEIYATSQYKKSYADMDVISGRGLFFGENADLAWNAINSASKLIWKSPETAVSRFVDTNIPGVFLYRCLMKNYVGWHLGDYTRFVY